MGIMRSEGDVLAKAWEDLEGSILEEILEKKLKKFGGEEKSA